MSYFKVPLGKIFKQVNNIHRVSSLIHQTVWSILLRLFDLKIDQAKTDSWIDCHEARTSQRGFGMLRR